MSTTTTQTIGAVIDIENSPAPAPTLRKDFVGAAVTPSAIELDQLAWGTRLNGPGTPQTPGFNNDNGYFQSPMTATPYAGAQTPYTGAQTPSAPMIPGGTSSRPSPRGTHEPAMLVQTWNNPPINKWRILSGCFIYMVNGMADSAPGALIPYMEKYYNISYATVSMIFIGQAVGFISAAIFNQALKSWVGQARSLMISMTLITIGFAILAGTPPFPAVVVAFFLNGYGAAINLALNNVFLANLADSTTILGIAQGAYGIGGTAGPFIATAMVSTGLLWSRYYLVTMSLSVLCIVVSGRCFWGIEQEASYQLHNALQNTANATAPSKKRLLLTALRNSVTPIGALFTFCYQGAEVSISGWVISFLINERAGDPAKVGYVTAGFWGGITLGRFVLSPIAERLNVRRFIFFLGTSALGLTLLVWLVPNIVGDAVAVALVGFVLGPLAPGSMAYFVRFLPRNIQTASVSFISSAGFSGGALAPFLTGLLAQSKGTWVLHPICIALFGVMLICWFALPNVEKRDE